MTGADFEDVRIFLRMSHAELGEALGWKDPRAVRRLEFQNDIYPELALKVLEMAQKRLDEVDEWLAAQVLEAERQLAEKKDHADV